MIKNQKINISERMDDFWVYPKLTKIKNKRDFSDNFFSFLEESSGKNRKNNIYIHIPFCSITCLFCPYYKIKKFSKEIIKDYCEAIKKELLLYSETKYYQSVKIDSIHFGGGDPLLIGENLIIEIVHFIQEHFNFTINENVSIEGTLLAIRDKEQLNALFDSGIKRLSFGIQTFNENVRREMGLPNYQKYISKKIDILKSSKISKYCFDMMYNLPDQSDEALIQDLIKVTALNPFHIDIYNMALFPNTTLERKIRAGEYSIIPSNERNIRMFKLAHNWLLKNEYKQITTATYSKYQEKIDIGDQLYLSNSNVLGIGASSRGYIEGMSYKNIVDIERYKSEIRKGLHPAELSYKASIEEDEDRKMVLFPITLGIKKIDIPSYERYSARINGLINDGFLEWREDSLYLTELGTIYSGNISSVFMDEYNWDSYIKIFLNSMKQNLNPYNEDKMGNFER